MKQLITFVYDKHSIIVTAQVPNGISATAAYYQKFIHSVFYPQIRKLFPEKTDFGVSILHNNAHPHVVRPVVDLFIDYTRETLRHPPYRPNLSPPDLDVSPK